MVRHRARAGLAVGVVLCLLAGVALLPSAVAHTRGARPALTARWPSGLLRVGQTLSVAGRVRRAPSLTRVALQAQIATGAWTELVAGAIRRRGRFELRWTVSAAYARRPVSLRVVALRHGGVLAASAAESELFGPAPVPCAPAVPPAVDIPPGDGWIEGGAYVLGGPAPGIDECLSASYTVTATNTSTGMVAATQTVAGGHSYTLVVPAGSYKLLAGGCSSLRPVIVTAAAGTKADADCLAP
jgi:hypothetical protein